MTYDITDREELHRTYGGDLNEFDFWGHQTMAGMAKKIRYAEGFDKLCENNIRSRDGYVNGKYKKESEENGNEEV